MLGVVNTMVDRRAVIREIANLFAQLVEFHWVRGDVVAVAFAQFIQVLSFGLGQFDLIDGIAEFSVDMWIAFFQVENPFRLRSFRLNVVLPEERGRGMQSALGWVADRDGGVFVGGEIILLNVIRGVLFDVRPELGFARLRDRRLGTDGIVFRLFHGEIHQRQALASRRRRGLDAGELIQGVQGLRR